MRIVLIPKNKIKTQTFFQDQNYFSPQVTSKSKQRNLSLENYITADFTNSKSKSK